MAELKVVTNPYPQQSISVAPPRPQQSLSVAPPQPQQQISVAPPRQTQPLQVTAPASTPKITQINDQPYEAKLSLSEFGKSIKEKYPQYASVDDTELANKMLAKYPQYQNRIYTPPQKEVKEPGFVQSFAQGVAKAPLRAFSTVAKFGAGLFETGLAVGNKLIGDEEGSKYHVKRGMEILDPDAEADFGYFGSVKPYTLRNPGEGAIRSFFDVAGGGAELASFGIGAPGVKSVGTQLLKGQIKQAGWQGLKYGAAGGGLQGLGSELQNPDATVGSVLTSTALGTGGGGILGGLLSMGGTASSNLVRTGLEKLFPKLQNASRDFANVVDTYFTRAFKPSIAGKKTLQQLDQAKDTYKLGVASILDNTPETALPKTVDEALIATTNTKKKIFKEYSKRAEAAGEQGAKIELGSIADELDALVKDPKIQVVSPGTANYASDLATRLRSQEVIDPATAEDFLAGFNSRSKTYWSNPNPNEVHNVLVDNLVANKLRNNLTEVVESMTDTNYAQLRKQYGALSELEKIITKASARLNNKQTIGFFDGLGDVLSAGDVMQGMLTFSPAQVARGLTTKAVGNTIKYFRDPDRLTKKLFEESYKVFQRARDELLPKGGVVVPKTKLLPAPSKEYPKVAINVPMNMPSGKVVTNSATESIVGKPGSLPLRRVGGPNSRRTNRQPGIGKPIAGKINPATNQLYSVAGAGAGLEKDENGKVKFNPEKAAAAIALLAGGPVAMKKVKRIDKLTQKEMIDAIDYIRLKKPYNQIQEEYISKLVEKFRIPAKTLGGVANKFEELITKVNKKKTGPPFKGK